MVDGELRLNYKKDSSGSRSLPVEAHSGRHTPISPGVWAMRQTALPIRHAGLLFLLLACIAFAPVYTAHAQFCGSLVPMGVDPSGFPLPLEPDDVGEIENDGSNSDHACLCLLSALTIGNGISFRTVPMTPGAKVGSRSSVLYGVPFLSEIFHPPRV